MQINRNKLRQIILEEARLRVAEEMALQELFGLIVEQDKELSDKEYLQQYKKDSSFRKKVKDFFVKFDELSPIKKRAAIISLGILGAAGTQFAGDFAAQSQASDIASKLRAGQEAAKAKYFGTLEDLRNFRDAARAEGATPIDVNDVEAIESVKDKFMTMGVTKAPIIPDATITMQTGESVFGYTPASAIPDDEILPFVGMSKAEWESIIRTWLASEGGLERLEKFVGTSGKTQALFWAYGPGNQLFFDAYDENPDGKQGLWLPPEWSVAFDVVQKNKARAGSKPSPEDDLGIPITSTPAVWKETLKKYLHSFLEML
jgi:hypothetical protein